MYLDLFDELRLNKRLIKLTNFEVAAYWAELQSILKQVAFYVGRNTRQKLLLGLVLLVPLAVRNGFDQWFGLLSLPLLALYNGQRGKYRMKYLFYIYYPLHLALLYALALWI